MFFTDKSLQNKFRNSFIFLKQTYFDKVSKYHVLFAIILVFLAFAAIYFNGQKEEFNCDNCNIILIQITVLRADHVGYYGYFRNTTPNIDNLASKSVVFSNVYSQATWTLPSAGTIFTSLYPSQHGLVTQESPSFDKSFATFAEVLQNNSYTTAGFVDHAHVSAQYGFARGFAYWDQKGAFEDKRFPNETKYSGIEKVNGRAEDWILQNKGKKFFLFLHYFNLHAPYISPQPYLNYFDPSYNGSLNTYGKLESDIQANIKNPNDLQHLIAQYDGDIRYVDSEVGKLLNFLDKEGLERKTVIIILGDHGEEFMQHGRIGHTLYLYKNILHVPVIIHFPSNAHMLVNSSSGLIDVPETILKIAGINSPLQFEGIDMFNQSRDFVFSEYLDSYSIINPSEQLIVKYWNGTDFSKELYNLTSDPNETRNIYGLNPDHDDYLNSIMSSYLLMTNHSYQNIKISPLQPYP